MNPRFAQLAFTPAVKRLQELDGSRASYARGEGGRGSPDPLGVGEAQFIAERDSFHMATVSETGWPYLQHRGGPKGFLKVLDAHTLAFADFQGNRQHVSEGNLKGNDRVALILMDYANRRRLKLLGHARVVDAAEDPALAASLTQAGYRAKVERVMVIRVEAFDWNCPQHITPRFSETELEPLLEPLRAHIRELEEQLTFASSV
jgi:predicted pyridoxine 5'-phosphate oxidase superfamily flavin-nucleotide-binding protein